MTWLAAWGVGLAEMAGCYAAYLLTARGGAPWLWVPTMGGLGIGIWALDVSRAFS